jgi:ketosteroid isomerase-like protein
MKTPDPQLRQQLDAKSKKYSDAMNKNDAAAVAAFFTQDAVLVNDSGPREKNYIKGLGNPL